MPINAITALIKAIGQGVGKALALIVISPVTGVISEDNKNNTCLNLNHLLCLMTLLFIFIVYIYLFLTTFLKYLRHFWWLILRLLVK
jgi:hypothetical protein